MEYFVKLFLGSVPKKVCLGDYNPPTPPPAAPPATPPATYGSLGQGRSNQEDRVVQFKEGGASFLLLRHHAEIIDNLPLAAVSFTFIHIQIKILQKRYNST